MAATDLKGEFMHLNTPTVTTCLLVLVSGLVAAPVLIKGFTRRGTGIKYEKNFLIQRMPQFATLLNVVLIFVDFLAFNDIVEMSSAQPLLTLVAGEPEGLSAVISWFGVALLLSGLVFMVGGWYSLGEFFSTDAEILDGHAVRNTGMLKYVMHPIYSGIIQSVLGASLAATSLSSAVFSVAVVAPLWLARAKYEEKILTETLGQAYIQYGEKLHWRRLVPGFFRIGV